MKNVIITIFFILLALVACARGAELLVPSWYPTIQLAINAAADGDTIIVAPGTYTGPGNRDIDFLGKFITVRSTDPNDPNIVAATIIDCNGTQTEPHRGFYFHNAEDGNSIVDGFTITNGYANEGGGIYCDSSSPTITSCTITGNSAEGAGGIYCDSSTTTITNCTITGNSADYYGGGGIHCEDSNSVITGCIINDNNGGGICLNRSSAAITDCVISRNMSRWSGGGVSSYDGDLIITNSTISGNFATEGGGINCVNYTSTITNCTISGNSADHGGGLMGCNGPITNCTITANSTSYGGGLYKCICLASNCIIWDNSPQQIVDPYNTTSAIYSNVQGSWPGQGNIDADPCFVDADANDYHLKSEGWSWDIKRSRWTYDDVTSRCIDAGNPGSPLGDELLSIPDDPDNEWGQNLRIDMGAFGGTAEASIPPYDWALLADLTNDGFVDLKDYAFQAVGWLNSADQQPGDLNRDSLVDISDLALLVEDWLEQTTWH